MLIGRIVRDRPPREPRENVLSADVEFGAAIYPRELVADRVGQVASRCHEGFAVKCTVFETPCKVWLYEKAKY